VKEFKANYSSMTLQEVQEAYEFLDELRCKVTSAAELKCRKLRKGNVAFSPELNAARLLIKAWSLLLQKAKGFKISSRHSSRTLKKVNLPAHTRGLSIEAVSIQLKEAYRAYYLIKGDAANLRNTALENLAAALAEKGSKVQSKILEDLRRREAQRSTAKKLRFIRGKLRSGSTAVVSVTNAQGEKIEISNKLEVETAILASNKSKFSQSFHTPFYHTPLRESFGFKGLTTSAQSVLAGVYEYPEALSSYIVDMLSQWEKPEAIRSLEPVNMSLTLDQYRSFWNKANENISCYPSALSFSTMKAGSFDPDISFVDCTLTKIPLERGFAPSRWKHCLDVMILKKSGVTDLSGLRTIVLFPVDCNYAFKHVGRAMMKTAEQANALAPEQYGSRKRHRSINLAVNKALTFDILRQLKRPGAVCSNDAKSCYDLIGHTPASLSMQRVGVPKTVVNCLFTTLQEAVHQVRTGYGDSVATYGGEAWLVPIHGIGQGNGAGPAIWAVVSSPLLNALRAKGFGCDIVCPLSGLFVKFVGYAFVDDTDIIQSALADSPQDAAALLQQALDTWENSLKLTCGAIVPEKTVWWLIHFKWEGSLWRYASNQDLPYALQVNDITGDRKELSRLEYHQAYETLGVYLAPDGNSDAQVEKLKKLAIQWSDAMRSGRITRDKVWLAINTTIW
jgi:hypothetical protein